MIYQVWEYVTRFPSNLRMGFLVGSLHFRFIVMVGCRHINEMFLKYAFSRRKLKYKVRFIIKTDKNFANNYNDFCFTFFFFAVCSNI